MKRYMAITFLGLVLMVCNVWYGMAQTRTDRHAGAVQVLGTNLEVSNATNPYLQVVDTTNTAQARVTALDSSGEVGMESNHPLNLITNGASRIVLAADGTTVIYSDATNPILRVTDTTNTAQLDMRAYDSSAEIGTESNHPLSFVTNSAQVATFSTAGALTLSGVSIVQSNATNPYLYIKDTTNDAQAQLRAYDTVGEVGTTSAHGFNITTGGTVEMHIQSDGDVGIGTTSPAVGLHGVVTSGAFLWADSEADDTNKNGLWGVEHYDVDEEPFYGVNMQTTTAGNSLWLGGNVASGNAATSTHFYTAADNTTTTGSLRWSIQADGDLDPTGTGVIDIGNAAQYIGDLSYKTLTDRGCIVDVDPVEAMGILRGAYDESYDVRMPSKKHMDHGLRILSYSHFPGWIYDDGMYVDDTTKELRQGDEGVDLSGLVSLLIAATKDLDKRIAGLEQLTTYQPTSLEGGQR